MQDNRLDQFFRNKLNEGNFDSFNPAHWEEAKKLLARNKKRKRGFYWLLLALFALLSWGILFVIGTVNKRSPVDPQPATKLELAETPQNGQVDHPNIPEPLVTKENLPPNQKASLIPTDKLNKKVRSNVATSKFKKDQETEHIEMLANLNQNASRNTNQISLSDNNAAAFKDTSNFGLENLNAERSDYSLERLSVSVPTLVFNYDLNQPNDDGAILRNDRIKRVRMGWSGTLLVNPGAFNSPVQGMTIGFVYERYFSRHWMYGIRPSLQLRGNEGGFSKFEQITTFGFSSINTIYGLKANSLQFVSAPVYLAGEFGKHQFEAGFSVDLLLGAHGQLQEVSVEDQVVSNLNNINSGWIDTGDMKKISGNLFLGYKNAINNRLKTGITFFYNPAKIYPGLPNNQSQIIDAKWHLGWQVTYYIK